MTDEQYPNGMEVEASVTADFATFVTGTIFSQYMDVESYEDARKRLGKEFPNKSDLLTQRRYYIQTESDNPSADHDFFKASFVRPVGVSRSQLYGLITQLQNLIKNSNDTAAAMRSVANLYSKPDEVLKELDALRELISHHG